MADCEKRKNRGNGRENVRSARTEHRRERKERKDVRCVLAFVGSLQNERRVVRVEACDMFVICFVFAVSLWTTLSMADHRVTQVRLGSKD